jgi:hypothetical protein
MWCCSINNLTHGPVSEAGLFELYKDNAITPQTLVWREGSDERRPLEQTELAARFRVPLPVGDRWRTCTFSGDTVRQSEMCLVEGFGVAKAHQAEAQAFVDEGGWMPNLIRSRHFPTLGQRWARRCQEFREETAPSFLQMCALYLPVNILLQFLLSAVNARLIGQPQTVKHAAEILEPLFQTAVLSLPMASILFLWIENTRSRRPGFGESLRTGLSLWGPLAAVNLLLIIAGNALQLSEDIAGFSREVTIGLGLLLLFVWVRIVYASILLVERRLSPTAALCASWRITKGQGFISGFSLWIMMDVMARFSGLIRPFPSRAETAADAMVHSLFGLLNISWCALLYKLYLERRQTQAAVPNEVPA